VAERLGRALQKLVQRFESARDLLKPADIVCGLFYFVNTLLEVYPAVHWKCLNVSHHLMIKVLVAENATPWQHLTYASISKQLPLLFLDKANKFRRWQDAQAFLIGKLLLKRGLSEFGFQDYLLENLQYNAFNRPYISAREIDFNISHAGQYVICALSKQHRVGVDIEQVHPVDLQDFAGCFTARELDRLSRSSEFLFDFFNIWTIKEAAIKADGRGLQIPLQQFEAGEQIMLGDNLWHIHALKIAHGYVAHLATDGALRATVIIQNVLIS
jgi:4'-phosphopantetheinyl transferase